MKVLALASYPVEAAATRYRLQQFVSPLAERGITLSVRPFLDSRLFASLYRRGQMPRTAVGLMRSALRRLGDVVHVRDADVVLVQREAMIFGPPLIEWLMSRLGRRPLVLDLDDATYVSYTSPVYGRLGSALKFFGKTDDLIRWAEVVTCGNRVIADYVESKGARARIIPTVVDTERFRPLPEERASEPPVLGWIGTHSTFAYLETIFPALQELARRQPFRLKIVGAGKRGVELPGVEVESLDWSLDREVEDFQSFDIGLYPIASDEWAKGKSGFKAIQYMAVGLPYVVSPVGACTEIGEPGVTHLMASSQDEWVAALEKLLADKELRKQMGAAGRRHAIENYTVPMQADKLAEALCEAAGKRGLQPRGKSMASVRQRQQQREAETEVAALSHGAAPSDHAQTARNSPRLVSKMRLLDLALVALLPSFLKRPCYRIFFRYKIGKRVRIGLSIIDARECVIEDDVRIGHFNVVIGVKKFTAGDHTRIGFLNIFRGGDEISLGRYVEIIRMNEINSIPDPDVVNPIEPRFNLGAGSIITAGHKIDFTDRVEIGRRTILGGRNSSLWTHNRQRTRPIKIGSLTYVGSEIRVAPGGEIPSRCIVGIGSVITGKLTEEEWLIGGVPAKPLKPLTDEDKFLIERKTRPDLPDDI